MNVERALPLSLQLSALLGVALLAAACAAPSDSDEATEPTETTTAELRRFGSLGADGDSCTVRTNPDGTSVPGTEKGLDCCSNADPNDCVMILKPFPGKFTFTIQ